MDTSKQLRTGPLLLQRVSGSFAHEAKPSETVRTNVKWEDIPQLAIERARLEPKDVAGRMSKSRSWLSRALRGLEKLGWNDIGQVNDPEFYRWMVTLILEAHGLEAPGASAEDLEFQRIGRAHVELHRQIAKAMSR
jgi:hypothetical protein